MMMSGVAMSAEQNPYKRPASPTGELAMPPAKITKTTTGQLQINYLKREKKETIPLATAEEPLPRLLRLVTEYDGVLQRHESLAGNLGACPVGPILLKRFERLFEGPPRILKSNSRDPNITWLDVVEFAQNKPEQFDLEKTRNGIRVCQFYLKQCRVEISEEDYVLIRSGMPQKLIPPQPILEDEEKELGVIEVLDRNLGKIIHSADQVSARARQLVHRLKNRRNAILARREVEGDAARPILKSNDLPASPRFDQNGPQALHQPPPPPQPQPQPQAPIVRSHSPQIPSSGFTAVNNRHSLPTLERDMPREVPREPQRESQLFHTPREREMQRDVHREILHHHPEASLNGTPSPAHSHANFPQPQEQKSVAAQAEDWMTRFLTPAERAAGMTADTIRRENLNSAYRAQSRGETVPRNDPVIDDSMRMASMTARRQEGRRQSEGALPESIMTTAPMPADPQGPPVPIPTTPASLMPQQKPHTWNRDDGGPYKAEMISRMETMKRGERVIPPCDRCRRLHMDCIKNLTACLGCTKKHAKCSWKDVSLDELESTATEARARAEKDGENTAPTSSEWDNILKQTKSNETMEDRGSPASGSAHPAETFETTSNKASTPRMPSPPQNGNARPPSHPHESPRLDLRPPPLDQQLREAAEPRPKPQEPQIQQQAHPRPEWRPSPFQRPPSSQQQRSLTGSKQEDGGDRLAAIASQVYRSASQTSNRTNEARPAEAAS